MARAQPVPLPGGEDGFFHYDLYSQALAKLERGFARDLTDVDAMVSSGGLVPEQLRGLLEQISDELFRFPAVEPARLAAAVQRLMTDGDSAS